MDTLIEQIRVMSENGDKQYPCELAAKMDSTKPDCRTTAQPATNTTAASC